PPQSPPPPRIGGRVDRLPPAVRGPPPRGTQGARRWPRQRLAPAAERPPGSVPTGRGPDRGAFVRPVGTAPNPMLAPWRGDALPPGVQIGCHPEHIEARRDSHRRCTG